MSYQQLRSIEIKGFKSIQHQIVDLDKINVLIGQNDFDACGQNQYALFPSPCSLSWTHDSFFYKDGILVADTGNSRILWFPKVPTATVTL